jgi:hypothetical protein
MGKNKIGISKIGKLNKKKKGKVLLFFEIF